MYLPSFLHLSAGMAAHLIHSAKEQVIYCDPGLHGNLLGRDATRIALDVNNATPRVGFGDCDAVRHAHVTPRPKQEFIHGD